MIELTLLDGAIIKLQKYEVIVLEKHPKLGTIVTLTDSSQYVVTQDMEAVLDLLKRKEPKK